MYRDFSVFTKPIKGEDGCFLFYSSNEASLRKIGKKFERTYLIRKVEEDLELPKVFIGHGIYRYQSKMYIPSMHSRIVLEYDCEKQKFTCFYIHDEERDNYEFLVYGTKLFFVSLNLYREVVAFDMEQCVYEKIDNWGILSCVQEGERTYFIFQEDDFAIIPSVGKNYIYKVNLKTYQTKKVFLGETVQCGSSCMEKEVIWSADCRGGILLRYEAEKLEKIRLGKPTVSDTYYSNIFKIKEYTVVLPYAENRIAIYDEKKYALKELEVPMSEEERVYKAGVLYDYYIDGDSVFFWPWRLCGKVIELDLNSWSIKVHVLCKYIKEALDNNNMILDEEEGSLQEYIDMVRGM